MFHERVEFASDTESNLVDPWWHRKPLWEIASLKPAYVGQQLGDFLWNEFVRHVTLWWLKFHTLFSKRLKHVPWPQIASRTNFGTQRVCGWRCGRRYYWKTNDPIYDLRNLTFRYRNRICAFNRISASGFRLVLYAFPSVNTVLPPLVHRFHCPLVDYKSTPSSLFLSVQGFRARIKASMMISCLGWKNSNYTWPRQLLCTPHFR